MDINSPNLGIRCKTFFSGSVNVFMFHMEVGGEIQLKLAKNMLILPAAWSNSILTMERKNDKANAVDQLN